MNREQTVIAHFPSSTKANAAKEALASAGISDVHIRRNSLFGVSYDDDRDDILSGQARSLASLTLYSTAGGLEHDQATRILTGSDPSVSGYSAEGYGLAGGRAFTMVAFVAPDKVDAAVDIIKSHGGEV